VKLHTGNFEDFFVVKEDLSDVRFIAEDDKTPLKFHVESVDLVNQLIYIWVKVPQVAAGINTGRIWMYYGNEKAPTAQDAAGSFDANTALVLHFDAAQPGKDSTANANNAATVTATPVAAAQMAGGAKFDSGKSVAINDAPSLAVRADKGATISFWMKAAGLQTDAWLFQRASANSEVMIGIDQNAIYARVKLPNGIVAETKKIAALRADSWQHVALSIEPTKLVLFIDGSEVATTPIKLVDFAGAMALGADVSGGHAFNGEMDELRFDTVARNADWIQLQAANQGLDKLLKPQKSEQLGSGGKSTGFWSVIIGSQDDVGWAILGLLMVMAVICWFVMIGKGIYVGRVHKDNEHFLDQYRELGNADPALLDQEESDNDKALEGSPITQAIFGKHDHFQSSPIYRVYHRAIQETRSRLGTSVGARAAGLNAAAIASIRATLDTQIVREMQRLNSQMVLLTIAVAGGPFIGLFGTVVGVMIVFAAIAASGDVNINAIAPGVAAALAATVMGLFVAIPALFGYNYLTSRIKAATADMRVFADEFTTRLAEYYGDK
jgi:biopolymer transport protein ExbB